jgi:tripartite-type tricarboxylate transporter receptor subunit TctC
MTPCRLRRRHLPALALGLAAPLAPRPAPAQLRPGGGFPNRPIRVIVPYSAGGGTDLTTRLLMEAIRPALGQPIVVESRPGANGVIGTEIVARSEPDGHSLVAVTSGHVLNRHTMPNLPFDPVRDFQAVTLMTRFALVIVGGMATPFADLRGALAHARANPGALTVGSTTALGSVTAQDFARAAGISVTEVPYRGGGQMMLDIVAGTIDTGFTSPQSATPHLTSGRMRILGISSRQRAVQLPDVPTIAESGVEGFESTSWFGLLAPAGTPPAIAQRIHDAIEAAMRDPALRARAIELGCDGVVEGPEAFAAVMRADDARWAGAAAEGRLRPGGGGG